MGPGGAPPGAGGSGAALGPEAAGPERGERACGRGGVGMSRPPATGKMPGAPEDLLGDGAGASRQRKLEALIRDPRSPINVESLLVRGRGPGALPAESSALGPPAPRVPHPCVCVCVWGAGRGLAPPRFRPPGPAGETRHRCDRVPGAGLPPGCRTYPPAAGVNPGGPGRGAPGGTAAARLGEGGGLEGVPPALAPTGPWESVRLRGDPGPREGGARPCPCLPGDGDKALPSRSPAGPNPGGAEPARVCFQWSLNIRGRNGARVHVSKFNFPRWLRRSERKRSESQWRESLLRIIVSPSWDGL